MSDSLSPELLYEKIGKLAEEIKAAEFESDEKGREFERSLAYLAAGLFFAVVFGSFLGDSGLSLALVIVTASSAVVVIFTSYVTLASHSPLVKQRERELDARQRLVDLSVRLADV